MSPLSLLKAALLLPLIPLAHASITHQIYPPAVSATEDALKWQPVLDWDTNTCYQTSAIDSSGHTNPGLAPDWDLSECRSRARLENCNTYARQRCNHGWCVYMYGYYSEMDWSPFSEHRHDWEHAMVWTRGGAPWSVMWSAHGNYHDEDPRKVRWHETTHPKLVAHKGLMNTASLRLATAEDDAIENDFGRWQACHLQQRETMDDRLGHILMTTNWGGAHMDLKDERFFCILNREMPRQAKEDGFDAWGGMEEKGEEC